MSGIEINLPDSSAGLIEKSLVDKTFTERLIVELRSKNEEQMKGFSDWTIDRDLLLMILKFSDINAFLKIIHKLNQYGRNTLNIINSISRVDILKREDVLFRVPNKMILFKSSQHQQKKHKLCC